MADVSGTLDQWSTTASSNNPSGTTVIGTGLDDNLREIQKVVRTGLAYYNAAAVASAGTTDLGAAIGNFLDISGTTTITGFGSIAAGIWKVIRFQDALTLTYNATSMILPGLANITTVAGDMAMCYSLGSGNWQVFIYQRGSSGAGIFTDDIFRLADDGDITKQVAVELSGLTTATTRTLTLPDYDVRIGNVPPGLCSYYPGNSAPTGWLIRDGSSQLITDYPALSAVIRSIYGGADGSHFYLPNSLGRGVIGNGTGITAEDITAVSANGVTVAANNSKWITGMPIILSNITGFTTSATAGPTYYVYRASSTNVRFCSTLIIAQNATTASMETISGTGTLTLTYTLTARVVGDIGGEEAHATSSTEQLAHTHSSVADGASLIGTPHLGGNDLLQAGASGSSHGTLTSSTGGNVAFNILQPYEVLLPIISY